MVSRETNQGPSVVAPRRGRRPLPAVVAGVLLLGALAAASLVRVAAGERVFRISGAATPVRLEPGWHLRVPGLGRVVRLPDGPLRAAGELPVRAREGVDLTIPWEIEAAMAEDRLASLLGSGAEPAVLLEAAAEEAIAAWARDASAESLVLLDDAGGAEASARPPLESRGFEAVALRLGKPRATGGIVAAIEARALRERIAETGRKIALIGLDGADWEIIEPLIAAGRLPHLARLRAGGAWGNMKTLTPALSPLLWTTVATGRPPEEHGIFDFLVKDAATGRPVPVSSRRRRVKALWNIFGDAGRTSAFVAWWATWPAEPVNGTMVSDRVAYSLFDFVTTAPDPAGATHPPDYFGEIRPLLVDDADIGLEEVRRFVKIGEEEFRRLRQQVRDDPKTAYRQPVNHLTKILASARSYHAIGLDLLRRGQPDLFSVYYQGIDEVCHRFAHAMPPKMEMVTPEEYAAWRDAVFAFYAWQDARLGELLAALDPQTTVIVMSDHGFKNGSSRPTDEPPYIEGKPGLWHRRYGILIMAGPGIRRGRLDTSNLADVAPTILYLAGLPVAQEMKGRILEEAIDPAFLARYPRRTIPTYESVGRTLAETRQALSAGDSDTDAELVERLRNLGYIGGGTGAGTASGTGGDGAAPAGGETQAADGGSLMTGRVNEAGLHYRNKDYAKAGAILDEVLGKEPDFIPALTLHAQVQIGLKRWQPAIAAIDRIIALDPEGEKGAYIELGRVYVQSGDAAAGERRLRDLVRRQPAIAETHAALGAILMKTGRKDEAEKELLQALRLDPTLPDPLTELHGLYRGTDRVLALEPIVRQVLAKNDKSVVHRNWMGIIYEWKRQLPEAEREFKEAMALDPDYASTMANLGALYGRSGRLQEAVSILERAVDKDPENLEAWVNLGAAQGRLGHAKEAIAALETAREKGVRSTTLYNALALAYLQARQTEKALGYLRESLAIDPSQKDANELLQAVTSRS
jgi:predicted AlkP superfamily phosphohydrolase/phosphomutase/Tfp pilus assembly protein PilF